MYQFTLDDFIGFLSLHEELSFEEAAVAFCKMFEEKCSEEYWRQHLEEEEQAYIDWQNESQEMMLADYLSDKEEN